VPPTPQLDFRAILQALSDRRVDFIVVGGVASVLQGAPMSTFDLDVVHSREEGNIARLLYALKELEAWQRWHPERRLRPGASHLSSPGHQLLLTRFGPLDPTGAIGQSRGYQDLLASTEEIQLGGGLAERVLNLETLIAVKEEAGDEKDLAILPVLRRTLDEFRRR
jgi:hypothetical protein